MRISDWSSDVCSSDLAATVSRTADVGNCRISPRPATCRTVPWTLGAGVLRDCGTRSNSIVIVHLRGGGVPRCGAIEIVGGPRAKELYPPTGVPYRCGSVV